MKDNAYDELLLKCNNYCKLLEKLNKKELIRISGIKGSADSFFIYSILRNTNRPLILVLPEIDSALRIYYDISTFLSNGAYIFPPFEELEGIKLPASREIKEQRLLALKKLAEKDFKIAVFTGNSFTQTVPVFKELVKNVLKIEKGREIKLVNLVETLINSGYRMETFVEKKGDISVRGSILDIYPFTEENPLRLDFYGNTIDTIRTFDILTQKSIQNIEAENIYPAAEDSFSTGKIDEYLPDNTIVYVDDTVSDHESIIKDTAKKFSVILNSLETQEISFKTKSIQSFNSDIKNAIEELKNLEIKGNKVFLLFNSEGEKERFREILVEKDVGLKAAFLEGSLNNGFCFEDALVCFITDNEIFGRYINASALGRRKRKFFKEEGVPIKSVFEINTDDIVVHENYGIGKFLGLKSIKVEGHKKDFISLEYLNNDKLYVPVEDINKVQKYVGFEEKPVLSNLGTSQWEKAKEKAKEQVKKMAEDLLELYAARESLLGHSFSKDTQWQKEFEDAFIYEETTDQIKAISEVKNDMETGKPIDRLVCGDVGFGKTEVALRAAFKCAADSKQVAFICPTTILAEQHYNTFKERMADYPVNIGMLSRFDKKSEQKKIIHGLKSGSIDIVIGTHRLIQDDISFKDIGMLIIDDEQKFGVAQKEKLKLLKKSIYCLSLSATPIPRTLYLSLSGIREISNINTPPTGRLPIQTYILEYNDKLIKGAILREIRRQGEVYYVYNKVKTIEHAANRIRRLVPEAKVAVAHGQLSAIQLEKTMMDFYKKKYNVLVCSTIIEAGLDNPSANTIIIEDADDLGLSQLYQLRGRVGRSRVQAYAYFTYPVRRSLSETAMKRLNAIEECDQLSMGYSIAMKDLEIRGAGNILGREQHGQIGKVGLELYMKLLKEAVNDAKGVKIPIEEEQIHINININAYIPDYYINDGFLKINVYKDLMAAGSEKEIIKVKEELKDRFGNLPLEVVNLLQIVEIRLIARKLKIISIDENKEALILDFKEKGSLKIPVKKDEDKLALLKEILCELQTRNKK